MTLGIEALRAAFKKNENEGTSRPNNYYPFWNMKEGESATVRFLPDSNQDNPMGFMVEKVMHNLTINGERKSTPCLKMYDEDCPICKVSAAYYKSGDEANGKKYWKKKQHLAQALITEDPLEADPATGEKHEGKVRCIALGFQIFNIIKESFESGELDEVPFAFDGGCNFTIKKTQQGIYASYAIGTKFARKPTDLDEDTIAAATDQMIDLSSLLPPNPGLEKTEALLEADLTGEPMEDSGQSAPASKPKTEAPASKPKTEAPASKPTKVEEEEEEVPVAAVADDEFDNEADQILQQIRNRRNAKAT